MFVSNLKSKIMKTIFLTVFLLAVIAAGAQEISNQVVANSGGEYSNSNISMSWTIGETITETFSADGIVLTQGFHQSTYTVTRIDELLSESFKVDVFPNPVTDYLNVNFTGDVVEANLSLFDINGRLILETKVDKYNSTINMSDLPDASYVLNLVSSNGKEKVNFKIIKNQ
jgi:hypothetical protein